MTICEIEGCKRPACTAIYSGSEWLKVCKSCADRLSVLLSGSTEYLNGLICALATAKNVNHEHLN